MNNYIYIHIYIYTQGDPRLEYILLKSGDSPSSPTMKLQPRTVALGVPCQARVGRGVAPDYHVFYPEANPPLPQP